MLEHVSNDTMFIIGLMRRRCTVGVQAGGGHTSK